MRTDSFTVYIDEIENVIALFAFGEKHKGKLWRYTKKFSIDCTWDPETRTLAAAHDGNIVCTQQFPKDPPGKEDYLDLFIQAVKILVKRQSIIVGYRFMLE